MAAAPNSPQIDQDVMTIVGPNFSADHLGTPAFDAIVNRARKAPGAYLDAFRRRFLGPSYDAEAFSHLHPQNLLLLVDAEDHAGAKALATEIAAALDRTLTPSHRAAHNTQLFVAGPDEASNRAKRLQIQRHHLRKRFLEGP